MSLKKLLLAAGIASAATVASAAPVTYTMVVDNVTATANGTAVGPGATVTITVQSDTTSVTNNGSGRVCAPGTSGTIAVGGGATYTLSGTYYICANTAGNNIGLYNTLYATEPVHGGNSGPSTGALTGSPTVDLVSNLTTTTYNANSIHSHGELVNLTVGTYSANEPEASNTTASTFTVATTTAATSVPTLNEYALLILSLGIAGFGYMNVKRRVKI